MKRLVALLLAACNTRSSTAPDARAETSIFAILKDWYDASEEATIMRGDAGEVTAWDSRTHGHNYPFSCKVVSFGAGVQVEPNMINGHPALHVGRQFGILSPCAGANSPDLLVAIVAAYSNPASETGLLFGASGVFLAGNTGDSFVYGGTGPIESVASNITSDRSGWNDGKFHTFGFVVDRDSGGHHVGRLRVDGNEKSDLVGDPSLVSEPDAIGGIWSVTDAGSVLSYPLEGYVAEVMVAEGATATQIEELSAYFMQKYGLKF